MEMATHFKSLFILLALAVVAGSAWALTCGFDIACSPDQNFATIGDVIPPTISAVAANVADTNAVISWNTNEDANSLIQYGLTAAYGSSRADITFISPTHSFTLLGLTPGTVYHYKITACDSSKNCASTVDLNFSTTGVLDVTAPIISPIPVNVTNLIDRNATISFITNELADTNIEYDINSAAGFSFRIYVPALVTSHAYTITGLSPLTGYKFHVSSRDAAGNASSFTPTQQFTTTDTLPAISGITISNVTANSATVQWNTDINADSQIEYGTTTSYGFTTIRDANPLRAHQQVMTGLNPNTVYHFRVLAKRCSVTSC